MNRNDAPQIAPSNVSSIGVTQPDPTFDCSAGPLIRFALSRQAGRCRAPYPLFRRLPSSAGLAVSSDGRFPRMAVSYTPVLASDSLLVAAHVGLELPVREPPLLAATYRARSVAGPGVGTAVPRSSPAPESECMRLGEATCARRLPWVRRRIAGNRAAAEDTAPGTV